MTLDGEIWEPIKDFPYYEISNYGRVKSRWLSVPKILKPLPTYDGYLRVYLCRQKKKYYIFIHHLVLEAFVGSRPSDYYVTNHKDGIKTNNKYNNLEWVTPSENMKHAFKIGLQTLKGIMSTSAKLRDEEVIEIRRLAKHGFKEAILSRMFKVHQVTINDIIHRRTWSHI